MKRGFSIIEIIVTIALTAVLITVITVSVGGSRLGSKTKLDAQAWRLLEKGAEALKTASFESLTNRTNDTHFLGAFANIGSWSAVSNANAPSLPNVLANATSIPVDGVSSLLLLPYESYGNFTLNAKIKILPSSPSDWKGGFIFRGRDMDNHYRLLIKSDGRLVVEKNENSTLTTLYETNKNIESNVWHTLKIIAQDSNFDIYLNDNHLTAVSDQSFSRGALALVLLNSALAHFDNISLTDASGLTNWQFDDLSSGLPLEWQRMSIDDLPQGKIFLTIENFASDITTLKKITLAIEYAFQGKTKQAAISLLRGQ